MKKLIRFVVTVAGLVWLVEAAMMLVTGMLPNMINTIIDFPTAEVYYGPLRNWVGLDFWPTVKVMIASASLWLIPFTRRSIGRGIAGFGTTLVVFGITITGDRYYKVPLEHHHVTHES